MLQTPLLFAHLVLAATSIHVTANTQPVNDASVTVEDCHGKTIADRRTGPDGVVSVDLDPKLTCVKIIVHAVGLESNTHTETWNPTPPVRVEVKLRRRPRVSSLLFGAPSGPPLLVYAGRSAVSYDRAKRVPRWVAERIDVDSVELSEGIKGFEPDSRIAPFDQPSPDAFAGSEFVPVSIASYTKSLGVATIVVPVDGKLVDQWHGYNRWMLETLRGEKAEEAFIVTGPLFLPGDEAVPVPGPLNRDRDESKRARVQYEVIGRNPVAVPTHFFRAILARRGDRQVRMWAQIVPNRPIDGEYAAYERPTNWVEYWAGVNLWSGLPADFSEKLKADVMKEWVESPFALPSLESPER
ncbi:MAG: DNA/RNA non-specific endonuclease [Pirellulaceae bacterium]